MAHSQASSPEEHGAFTRRVASQGALLFSGFAAAQICSFLRNAILGHCLAKGDFGIAATLTMVLQLVESLTDTGADRLVVQAPGGDSPRFVATAHSVLIGRGMLTAIALYLASGPFCSFLDITEAQQAFELVALVPLIKAFCHLDTRRAQRGLDNRPQMLIEVVPQLIVLALTVPVLGFIPNYAAVAALSLAYAGTTLLVSHAVAHRPYAMAADGPVLRQLIAFGWPIWLSAFPLCAVYQGDRIIIGKLYGMEVLAGYSVAFMITMVPGLIAAKVGQALILPVLTSQRDNPRTFANRYTSLSTVTALAAALYFVVFGVAGECIVPLAFGPNYTGLGPLTAWLALMWMVRMVQVVPGMAVMAHGETQPFLIAGLIRAASLPAGLVLALQGFDIVSLAAAGTAGELASFAYIVWRAGKCNALLPAASLNSTLWLGGVAAVTAMTAGGIATGNFADRITCTLLLAACVTGYAVASQPTLRDGIAAIMPPRRFPA